MLMLLTSNPVVRFIYLFFPILFNHVLYKVFKPVVVVRRKNEQHVFPTIKPLPYDKFHKEIKTYAHPFYQCLTCFVCTPSSSLYWSWWYFPRYMTILVELMTASVCLLVTQWAAVRKQNKWKNEINHFRWIQTR